MYFVEFMKNYTFYNAIISLKLIKFHKNYFFYHKSFKTDKKYAIIPLMCYKIIFAAAARYRGKIL